MTTRFSAGVIAWVLVNVGMGYGVLTAMGVPGHGFDSSGVHVKDVLTRILVGREGQKSDKPAPSSDKNESFDPGTGS